MLLLDTSLKLLFSLFTSILSTMVTFQAVKDAMTDLAISCWQVKGKNGSMIGYQDEHTVPLEVSIARLEKLLSCVNGDFVRIELHPKAKKTGTNKPTDYMKVIKMDVDLKSLNPGAVAGVAVASDGVTRGMIDSMNATILRLEKELIETKYINQIADLKKEIAGVKDANPMDKMIEVLIPVITGALTPGAKAPHAMAGIEGSKVYERYLELDPQGDAVIGSLVWLIENNVDQYNMYKPMLLNLSTHGKQ